MTSLPEDNKLFNNSLYIVSKPNGVAIQLIELLIVKNIRVELFAENLEEWEMSLEHIKNNAKVGLNSIASLEKYDTSKKVLYFDESFYNTKSQSLENKFLNYLDEDILDSVFVIFNSAKLDSGIYQDDVLKGNRKVKEIYVTDFFGPRLLTNESSRVMYLMLESIFARAITLPALEFSLFPIPLDLTLEIVLGFIQNPRHESIHIKGNEMKSHDFAFLMIKLLDELKIKEDKYLIKQLPDIKAFELIPKFDITEELKKTIRWYEKSQGQVEIGLLRSFFKGTLYTQKPLLEKERLISFTKSSKEKTKGMLSNLDSAVEKGFSKTKRVRELVSIFKKIVNTANNVRKHIKASGAYRLLFSKHHIFYTKVIGSAVLIALLPVIISALSSVFLYGGINSVRKGKVTASKNFFWLADKSAYISEVGLYYYAQVPFVQKEMISYKEAVSTVRSLSDIAHSASSAAENVNILLANILGSSDYDLTKSKNKLILEIDSLYNKTSFLEGDINFGGFGKVDESRSFLAKIDIPKRRNELLKAKDILSNLDYILGDDKEKNYLLLFQNNMELRATGGFIGSFAIAKMKDGRLTDINVMDVYSADGQLKGHVEPPYPIKKYLGEANWYLRDSNWNPNFPVSAERAEWFLSKEIEMDVDGVIALDLNVVKDLLEIVGPVHITDFNKEVTADNFYEVVQYEVEEGFFPGSRKKSNFLSALSKELIIRLAESKKLDSFMMAKVLYENLEGRHIQLYFNDNQLQKTVSQTGWAGELDSRQCDKENCFNDYVAVNESNFGVNKANFFVERTIDMDSYLDERILRRKLTITLKSNANVVLGERGKYKTYVRIIVPKESSFEDIRLISKGETTALVPEVESDDNGKVAGVWVEVSPQTTAKILFSWTTGVMLNFEQNGEYNLKLYKQAGIDELKGNVNITTPKGYNLKALPQPQLTNTGLMRYNLEHTHDFETKLSW